MKHPIKAILGLLLRLYFGYGFITAGLEKWETGFGAKDVVSMMQRGAKAAEGAHPSVSGWWLWIMNNIVTPNAGLFAFMVKCGEVLVGLGLILGLITTLAALFGMIMNLSFLLSGTLSSNAQYVIAFVLIIAWGAAAYEVGLDRIVMPKIVAKYPKLSQGWLKRWFPVEN